MKRSDTFGHTPLGQGNVDNVDAAWSAGPRVRIDSLRAGSLFRAIDGIRYRIVRRDDAMSGVYHVVDVVSGHKTSFAGCAEVVASDDVGLSLALQQLQSVATAGAKDERVVEWAKSVDVGGSVRERAVAILARVCEQVRYRAASPAGESLSTPFVTLFHGGIVDEDDFACAFSAACTAIGLRNRIRLVRVGHSCTVVTDVQDDSGAWITFTSQGAQP